MIVKINTHPIVTGMHEEFHIKWCGRLIDTRPKLRNGLPIFFLSGSQGSMELNTVDMKLIERSAKSMTCPRGRAAVTTDKTYIYIIEEDDKHTLIGVVTHNHIKEYRSMYDEFECN